VAYHRLIAHGAYDLSTRYNTHGRRRPVTNVPPAWRAQQGDGELATPQLLHVISTYGYVGFAGLVFIAAVGVPLPLSLLLFAMGGLSAAAGGPNLAALLLIGIAAAVAGDTLDYAIGRMGSSLMRDRVLRLLRRLHPRASAATLDRIWLHQGLAVFVTRCALTALSVPVSLLAGASRMRLLRFLAWETAGKGVFVVVTLMAGRLFGGSLLTLGPVPTIVAALAVLAAVALVLLESRRWWAQRFAALLTPPVGELPRSDAPRPFTPLH
jgi:membrane protein DedA with SNARE-associated domain